MIKKPLHNPLLGALMRPVLAPLRPHPSFPLLHSLKSPLLNLQACHCAAEAGLAGGAGACSWRVALAPLGCAGDALGAACLLHPAATMRRRPRRAQTRRRRRMQRCSLR